MNLFTHTLINICAISLETVYEAEKLELQIDIIKKIQVYNFIKEELSFEGKILDIMEEKYKL